MIYIFLSFKTALNNRMLYLAILFLQILTISACTGAIKDWVSGGSSDPPSTTQPTVSTQVYSWDFSDPLNYTFDVNYLDVANGKVSINQVDQIHSGNEFYDGNHVGSTTVNGVLTLQSKTDSSLHVNQIFPSKSSNLAGYWRMDNDWIDSSGNGVNGMPQGNTSYSSNSKIGIKSGSFDGAGDNVELGVNALGDLFTISVWIKTALAASSPAILTEYEGGVCGDGDFRLNGVGQVLYDDGSGTGRTGTVSVGDDIWHHIVYVSDLTNSSIYVDGILDNVGIDLNWRNICNTQQVLIGSRIGTNFFDGSIDELAIWKEALSATEIATLFRVQANNYTELSSSWAPKWNNIIGYWKMDGNWQDSSGRGNHGAVNGDAAFNSNSKVGTAAGTFDGTGDFLNIPYASELNPAVMTISAWLYVTGGVGQWRSAATARSSSPQKGFSLYATIADKWRFQAGDNTGWFGADSVTSADLNTWFFVVGTYDGTNSKIYINGVLEDTQVGTFFLNPVSDLYIGAGGDTGNSFEFPGVIDEMALWNVALSAREIGDIYNRQKQKYAGHFDSPVIDLETSGSWDNLIPKTTLPFYKELSLQSENSSNYSLLNGDLSNGLVGYWPLDEVIEDTVGGSDYEDRSNNNNHGIKNGSIVFGNEGVLSFGAKFVNSFSNINIPSFAALPIANSPRTISLWANLNSDSWAIDNNTLFSYGSSLDSQAFLLDMHTYPFVELATWGGVGQDITVDTGLEANPGWTHFVVHFDGSIMSLYVNGEIKGSFTPVAVNTSSTDINIGNCRPCSSVDGFNSDMDEVAIWNRALTATEIQQLYRRSANRIKYKVKSCVDAACKCKSLDAVGDDNDCDGDGTPNASDASDIHFSEWLGKDGATGATFSELQNCSSIDILTGDCDIASLATVNMSAPNFEFSRYPVAAGPTNNRYFQYRVIMEAEENTACSGTACLPELTSVEVGPSGRYFGGTYAVTSSSSVAFVGLTDISFNTVGSCALTYQLSPDGTNYYYWNGSSWAVGNGVEQSSNASAISDNITSFAPQVGSGNLHWKAYMNSNSVQSCEIDQITVTVVD